MRVIILLILTLNSFNTHAQSLEGEWEGRFTDLHLSFPIFLDFKLEEDSSYSITSYSTGDSKVNVIVCAVMYKRISEDSVYLEEMSVIKPHNYSSSCLQKMYLKIFETKNKIELRGAWTSSGYDCDGYGEIMFWKKKLKSVR